MNEKRERVLSPLSIVLLCAIYLFQAVPSLALDTTEVFAVGPFTNFEGYYSFNYSKDGQSNEFNFSIGGGFHPSVSYVISGGVASGNDSVHEGGGLSLGIIWTPVKNEFIELDFMPGFSFDPNHSRGKMTFTNFKSYSYGMFGELNLKILRQFQPYLTFGFMRSFKNKSDNHVMFENPLDGTNMVTVNGVDVLFRKAEYSNRISLGAGFMFKVTERIQFLSHFIWSPEQGYGSDNRDYRWRFWTGSSREIAVGLNGAITQNIEIITQFSWEHDSASYTVQAGLIYAL